MAQTQTSPTERSDDLQASPMMRHLMDALKDGKDIGHYGRLVFVMVARFFLPEEKIVALLAKDPDFSKEDAKALYAEVKAHGYNPPKENKIRQWQQQQDFPICPSADDPNACDVYQTLRFPDEVYDNIEEFWEQRVEAQS
ncbi:MAG TPA: hypothetical protein VFB58_01145 [Chloroflexota bacterium]|nr:hypothetical protein [Chloroflexota bacterium]